MSFPTEGGCLCGAIRYRITAAPVAVMHCHCSNCRKASGAGMLTWMTVNPEDFTWLQGEPQRYRYASEHYDGAIERLFCGGCGTQLCWSCDNDDPTVDVTAGSLDDPSILEPEYHVFTRGQVGWVKLDDGLPRYETRVNA